MNTAFTVALEMDYSARSEGFREQLSRLYSDGRFEVRILRGPDSMPSHAVKAEELEDVDFYILQGHRNVALSSLAQNGRLKWIGRFGAGFENVDIEACNTRGVILSNAPYGLRESVAELALAYILSFSARLTFFNSYIRQHHFAGKTQYMTRCAGGRTLGLIGSGGIAQRLAQLVSPLEMKVIAYDRYADTEAMLQKGIELRPLEEVLQEADYISVHVPLTKETRGLLGEEHFRMMKPTACFINTSRGGIYEDRILAKVLREGCIAGAAVDVFEDEPDIAGNPLLECDTALLTPHTAGAANNADAITAVMKFNVDNIFTLADGKLPDSIVNPEVIAGTVPEKKISPSFNPDRR
jgi:D-3-phosphoglycerate dehydrogenase / 2-oxoglutarate reductase